VAFQAKSPDVLEVTLAAAFDHRNDMVGIPEAFSQGRAGTKTPVGKGLQARQTACSLQMPPGSEAIDSALSADTPIAL
jgi:hypothetical protein